MGRDARLRALLPRPLRQVPPDLAALVGLVVVSVLAAVLPGVRESPLRAVLGATFVLFAPGYAIIATLFPEAGDSETSGNRSNWGFRFPPRDGVTVLERVVFSVGLSVAVVPLVGLALNFSPWPIEFTSLTLSIGGLTIGMAAAATVRRWRVSADQRFRVPYDEWVLAARSEILEPTSRLDAALNVALVASVLVAAGGGAYAVLGPQQGQSYTEFYLLGENESGSLVADDYPTTLEEGENATVIVGISNHEHRQIQYTVVSRLQRVQVEGNETTVTRSRRVGQFRPTVGINETVHRRHTVQPGMTGEQLRLQYLLYVDDPPADLSAANAYRAVHIWINATGS